MNSSVAAALRSTTGVLVLAAAIGAVSWLVADRALPGSWSDAPLYAGYADAVFEGAVPYRDVMIEYPPGALIPLLVPRLFGSDAYLLAFTIAMAVCGLVLLALADALMARLGFSGLRRYVTVALLAAAPLVLGTVVLERFDLFPAALVAGALLAQLRRSWAFAGILLGLGAAAKVYPAVLLPVMLLFALRLAGRRAALRSLAGFAAAVLAVTLPLIALAGPEPLRPLLMQVERPLHLESTGAAVLHAAHQLGAVGLELENSFGSHNLVGFEPRVAEVLSAVAAVGLLASVALLCARLPATDGAFVLGCASMLLALVVTSKVLSPQFLVWLAPAAILVPGAAGAAAALLTLAVAVLTHALYPGGYVALLRFEAAPSWLLVTRNVVLLAAAATLLVALKRQAAFRFSRTASGAATAAAAAGSVAVVALVAARQLPPAEEAVSASWTELVAHDFSAWGFVPLTAGREPLFEWLASVPAAIGFSPFTAGRIVSALAALATVALAAGIGRALGGPRLGLLAALLAATCPFLLVYGSLGLYVAPATALALAVLVLQEVLARTLRVAAALGLGLVLGLALLAAASSALLLVLWPLSLLRFDWARGGLARRLARLGAFSALALLTALAIRSVVAFSDWHEDFVAQRAQHYPHWQRLRDPLGALADNAEPFLEALVGYVTLPVLAAAAAGLVVGVRRSSRLTLLVASWALVPWMLAVLLSDVPFPRHVHVVAPPLLVLAAVGLAAGIERVRGAARGTWAVAAVVVLVLIAPLVRSGAVLADPPGAAYPGLDDVHLVTGPPAGTGWPEIREELLRRAGPGRHAVVRGPHHNRWLEFSLREDARFHFVENADPEAARALFTVGNGEPPPLRPGGLAWRQVAEAARPRGGTPVALYEAGVELDGTFLPDPEALRGAIGGGDADYDAFVGARPEIREWADAEYLSRG